MGYSDMSKKPFDPLKLVADGYEDVIAYVQQKPELKIIATKMTEFLNGFYSDFALELLSSIYFISQKEKTLNRETIASQLETWSDRKRSIFSNPKYLDISLKQLSKAQFAQ